jgi:copper resistance protein D
MELLVDLFGYLSIVVHGLTILSQSVALGGVLFLVFLARPLNHPVITAGTARIAGIAAIALLLSEAATVALQAAVLADTVDLPLRDVLTADFAIAGLVKTAVAARPASCCWP